jgi:alkylhydroperoxidase/carboxymuconolactone decarboxylase family protein YurZ
LIVVAVVAAAREQDGELARHLRYALDIGCTEEALLATLQTAAFHTGALTLVHGVNTLIAVLRERGLPVTVAEQVRS